ncbi:hypothetical protein N9Y58_01415 [Alphaproteobacteria bacterium]|nr:hypothetical protein [Alphaproteobacteria bacterium]
MANTFDTSRVGGGTYELAQDANGNYNLKSVGFNQVNKLNLPDLKDSNTSVADTTKKATEDTIKTQTTEVFKPTNVYQGGDGGGGQSYQTMADSKFAKEAKVNEATVSELGQKTNTTYNAMNDAEKASVAAGTSGMTFKGVTGKTYSTPRTIADQNKYLGRTFTDKTTGLQKVQSAVQNTVGNVVDSVKSNKAVQMAGTVLGFAINPVMAGAKMVAGMLPKDSPTDKFNRGYFPTNDTGRINTNPANNVFGGMNAVSAFGNIRSGAVSRVDTRTKTAAKNVGKWSPEKMDKFNKKTETFQTQLNQYDKDKKSNDDDNAPGSAKSGGANVTDAKSGDTYSGAAYGYNEAAEKSDGGSGGSGGGRVICTDLHRTGELSTKDWIRDTKFTFKTLSKTHVKGYLLWAEPTVKHIQKYPRYRKMWKHIAQHRANDIAWRLNEGKFDLLGRIYAGIGEPVCWALGNFVSDKQISKYNLTHWRRA